MYMHKTDNHNNLEELHLPGKIVKGDVLLCII